MIATEGRVVVIYLGLLQPKKSLEKVMIGHQYSKVVLMQLSDTTLSRYSHEICARIPALYILLAPLVPSLSGGGLYGLQPNMNWGT